jgi:hypothetical protein
MDGRRAGVLPRLREMVGSGQVNSAMLRPGHASLAGWRGSDIVVQYYWNPVRRVLEGNFNLNSAELRLRTRDFNQQ